ncbi:hypothetical protein VTK56DRAFT_7840 [Thermocarpiscus australiensis]
MNGYAASVHPLSYEEDMILLGEKSPSNVENDARWAVFESRFSRQTRQWISQAQSPLAGLRSILLRTGFFLLPSFIHARLSHDPRCRTSSARLGPTSYLDGMRGLAALFVFFCHFSYTSFLIADGWGYRGNNHLLKLPFLRLFYSGPPMVCVFFVISGYALSLKPLRLIHARDPASLASAMSSLVFRRGIRLFLPPALSTLLIVLLVRLGAYEWTRDVAADGDVYHWNAREPHYARLDSAAAQLADWAAALFDFVHVWDWAPFGGSTALDVHLWTIPVEFRCSMVLFLTLLGTARLRTARLRFAAVGALAAWVYRCERWEMLLFYAGMLLAEMDVIRGVHGGGGATTAALPVASPPSQMSAGSVSRAGSPPSPLAEQSTAKRALWIAVSILGLYFMSQPDQNGAETPGWVFLTGLIPDWWSDEHRYWQSIGAVLFVLAVGRSSGWQRFFNLGVVQYLGRISYAIYLMHGPVLHTVGYAVERWAWGLTGVSGKAYPAGFALASVFVIPVVIWASDVFWRAVDAPVVRFAKWLEERCSISE